MLLTPHEQDRLLVHVAAMVARDRKARGVVLNYPEAVALITSFVLEGARDGRPVIELMETGRHVLTREDVMDGDPGDDRVGPGRGDLPGRHQAGHRAPADPVIPGEVITPEGVVTSNVDLPTVTLEVVNTADRPVQVGSHYHFAASNPALRFDRDPAWGMRLDIPAGTAVRFEPGVEREVQLVRIGGARVVPGLRPEWAGPLDGERSGA